MVNATLLSQVALFELSTEGFNLVESLARRGEFVCYTVGRATAQW